MTFGILKDHKQFKIGPTLCHHFYLFSKCSKKTSQSTVTSGHCTFNEDLTSQSNISSHQEISNQNPFIVFGATERVSYSIFL